MSKKIGILTGGGDCPGLNPAIRGCVYAAERMGYECVGFLEGWKGIVEGNTTPLDRAITKDIISVGGTMQVSDIRGAMLVDEAASEADFVIRPKLGDISFIEMNRTIEAADRGLEESYRKLNPAKESLILFSLKNVYGKYKKN